MVQGPAYPGILQRTPCGVDCHIQGLESGPALQLVGMTLLPATGLADGDFDYAEMARLVLRSLRQRLRNDSDSQSVGPRRATPVVRVPCQQDGIVMRPGDEIPWST